ncbi:MAG: cobalamin-dependent protein [Myxococcaceae bacterium]|nr:cobalamin-dependent protein [Myxococcaceae bacterium]
MLAHRGADLDPELCSPSRPPPAETEVAELAALAASHDLDRALAFIERLCREGMSIERILIDLVTPAARLLGAQWKADLRGFTDVSAGLGTLQQLVHILGPSFAPQLPHRGLVVLTSAPGEQHTLGLQLVGEFLRREGYGVHVVAAMPEPDLIELVATEHVDLLGVTVSNTALLKPLAGVVAAARRSSLNRGLDVMVGGSLELDQFAANHGTLVYNRDVKSALGRLARENRSVPSAKSKAG